MPRQSRHCKGDQASQKAVEAAVGMQDDHISPTIDEGGPSGAVGGVDQDEDQDEDQASPPAMRPLRQRRAPVRFEEPSPSPIPSKRPRKETAAVPKGLGLGLPDRQEDPSGQQATTGSMPAQPGGGSGKGRRDDATRRSDCIDQIMKLLELDADKLRATNAGGGGEESLSALAGGATSNTVQEGSSA